MIKLDLDKGVLHYERELIFLLSLLEVGLLPYPTSNHGDGWRYALMFFNICIQITIWWLFMRLAYIHLDHHFLVWTFKVLDWVEIVVFFSVMGWSHILSTRCLHTMFMDIFDIVFDGILSLDDHFCTTSVNVLVIFSIFSHLVRVTTNYIIRLFDFFWPRFLL